MYDNKMKKLIFNYLDEVKKELPWWIKNEKKELSKVLNQLETHIWEKAEDLSEFAQPTEDSVQLALNHMGSPHNIAREYEQGKTPKIFISTELWPLFKTFITVLCANLIIINILGPLNIVSSYIRNPPVIPVNFTSGNILELLDEEKIGIIFFSILVNGGLFMGLVIITIIFFWLSNHGNKPDKFKNYRKRINRGKIHENFEKREMTRSRKTGEPLKPFVNRNRNYIGAIVSFFWVIVMFLQFSLDQNLNLVYTFFGLFFLITSIRLILRAILGNNHLLIHQIFLILFFSLYMIIGFFISLIIWSTFNPALTIWNIIFFIIFSLYFLLLPMITFYELKKLEEFKLLKKIELYNN